MDIGSAVTIKVATRISDQQVVLGFVDVEWADRKPHRDKYFSLVELHGRQYGSVAKSTSGKMGSQIRMPTTWRKLRSIRTRDVNRSLRKLKADSATGPNGISAVIPQKCVAELAYPLVMFVLLSKRH